MSVDSNPASPKTVDPLAVKSPDAVTVPVNVGDATGASVAVAAGNVQVLLRSSDLTASPCRYLVAPSVVTMNKKPNKYIIFLIASFTLIRWLILKPNLYHPK